MNTGKIYLIRHGQTNGNGNQYVGWEDLPLNAMGMQQAAEMADILREESVDAIYTSALHRAVATVRPLAEQKKLPWHSTPLLNEIDYGEYQGRYKSELQLKLRNDFRTQKLPSGESLHDVFLRVRKFVEAISPSLASGANLAVVAHYWSIRMLLGLLQNKNFDDLFSSGGYKPANGSVYQFCYRNDKEGALTVISERYLKLKSESEAGFSHEKVIS